MLTNKNTTTYRLKEETNAMGMAGMMLLQISVLCTISELIIAITVLHWFMSSRKNKVPSNEIFLVFSEPPPSKPPSLLDLENVSEDSPKKIEDEIDVTN
uniref:Membrane-spanning 4-domains, subfamily A, member 20 n=1 Tax=Rattus norvegicus TaxID=10116 RepID=A0ABK0LIP2_RAT